MKAKRRAVSIILFAVAKGLEVSLDHMKSIFNSDSRGGLKPKDLQILLRKYEKGRSFVDDIRRIAQHLWDTSRA